MQINRITWSLMSIETTCLLLLTEEVDIHVKHVIIVMLELIRSCFFWPQHSQAHSLIFNSLTAIGIGAYTSQLF